MKSLNWKIGIDINNQEYIGNELLAKELSTKGYDALITEYVYIYPDKVGNIFQLISANFKGVGVDLGSGVGCISATIAQEEKVEKVYSVEVVKAVVDLCQPIVIEKILKANKNKVVSVVGDFDNLELPDNSLDFAVSWFSMHHSSDLNVTLKECLRVLKPNGKLVIIDRGHNNSTSNTEINRMLNIVYGPEFIQRNYRPKGTVLTRKENGEHEYRFKDWKSFFKKNGFQLESSTIIKTDSVKNRKLTNDDGIKEISVPFEIGCFGNRAVAYILKK